MCRWSASGGRNSDPLCRQARRNLRHLRRWSFDSGQIPSIGRWPGARFLVSSGRALDDLRTAVSRAHRALSDRARSRRDLPRAGRVSARTEAGLLRATPQNVESREVSEEVWSAARASFPDDVAVRLLVWCAEPLLPKMRIEREGDVESASSHHDEAYGINEADLTPALLSP